MKAEECKYYIGWCKHMNHFVGGFPQLCILLGLDEEGFCFDFTPKN